MGAYIKKYLIPGIFLIIKAFGLAKTTAGSVR
jgi:hypothetical protein